MSSPKILIVDDEPFNVDYLEQELEEVKCQIFTASNGQEALDLVQSKAPDLVLLDIMMPVMDGFQVLSALKADATTRDIPVIVVSAAHDLSSMVRGIQLGAEDYLPKPFEPVLLHARVSSSLEKKRLRDLQQLYLKSLERELEIAREIQSGFLPTDLPKIDGWEIAAYFKAAREVTGDFYDAFVLPDGVLIFFIGDVCGKGVGAALFMTLFRSLIRAASTTQVFSNAGKTTGRSPAERLQHVVSCTNDYIFNTHGDSGMFATVFIGSITPGDGTLTYINCGNESPLLLHNGVAATLKPTGPVMGLIEGAKYGVKEIQVEKDSLLLAFTDGIPDSLNHAGEAFGHERLLAALPDQNLDPAHLLEVIQTRVQHFIGPALQYDDITLMAVRREAG